MGRVNLTEMQRMSPDKLASLSSGNIAELQEAINVHYNEARELKGWLENILTLKYQGQSKELRDKLGKDTGTLRFKDGDYEVVSDLPKKIEWDQVQLAKLHEQIKLDNADPNRFIDINYKVSERKFNQWPEHIRKRFSSARTINVGKSAFKLIKQGGQS